VTGGSAVNEQCRRTREPKKKSVPEGVKKSVGKEINRKKKEFSVSKPDVARLESLTHNF
jgi:hypothetical protein